MAQYYKGIVDIDGKIDFIQSEREQDHSIRTNQGGGFMKYVNHDQQQQSLHQGQLCVINFIYGLMRIFYENKYLINKIESAEYDNGSYYILINQDIHIMEPQYFRNDNILLQGSIMNMGFLDLDQIQRRLVARLLAIIYIQNIILQNQINLIIQQDIQPFIQRVENLQQQFGLLNLQNEFIQIDLHLELLLVQIFNRLQDQDFLQEFQTWPALNEWLHQVWVQHQLNDQSNDQ